MVPHDTQTKFLEAMFDQKTSCLHKDAKHFIELQKMKISQQSSPNMGSPFESKRATIPQVNDPNRRLNNILGTDKSPNGTAYTAGTAGK